MFAALASRSTVSQPVSTTGENAMTSTRCAMKERSALIWFSCFCCASEKRSVMPASGAALWIGGGVGRAPFAFGADLAEAEHDGLGAIAGRDFGSPPEQATSSGRGRGGQHHLNEALHRSPLK